jgi:hypothetical protein
MEEERIAWLAHYRLRKRCIERAIFWYFTFVEEIKEGYVGSFIRVRNFLCVLDEFNITEYPYYAKVTPLAERRNVGAGVGKQYTKYFYNDVKRLKEERELRNKTSSDEQTEPDISISEHEPEE